MFLRSMSGDTGVCVRKPLTRLHPSTSLGTASFILRSFIFNGLGSELANLSPKFATLMFTFRSRMSLFMASLLGHAVVGKLLPIRVVCIALDLAECAMA